MHKADEARQADLNDVSAHFGLCFSMSSESRFSHECGFASSILEMCLRHAHGAVAAERLRVVGAAAMRLRRLTVWVPAAGDANVVLDELVGVSTLWLWRKSLLLISI
jgi:hypothetical protein